MPVKFFRIILKLTIVERFILPANLHRTATLVFVCSLLLANCSFFEPHKVLISQGSWVDEKKIDKLKIGMTKEQVSYLLGTPLIQDSFVRDRWIYLYSDRLDTELLRERRVQLDFNEDSLVRIEKTLPARAAEQSNNEETTSTSEKTESKSST